MNNVSVAFIGAGNMGSSLIAGLLKNGVLADHIWASDTSLEKLEQLREHHQIHITTNNHEAVQHADAVVFAVKPQVFSRVAQDLAPALHLRKPLLISIAAGVLVESIQKWVGPDLSIVRAMPNTPALIGCGATALFAEKKVKTEQRNLAESILRAVGSVVWVQEQSLLNAVTALSGSGPAYFFLFMEALEQTAQEMGLPHETAHLLTLQTALGAARMAIESHHSLTELRQHVTSPSGTTEKALGVFENGHLRLLVKKALQAAKTRSEELAAEQ